MPSDRARLGLTRALPSVGLFSEPSVTVEATIVREQDRFPTFVDTDGTERAIGYAPPPPGYTLWSARVQTDVAWGRGRPARLSLGVDNLLDTAYRDALSRYRLFAHDVGRNVTLRLDVPLGRGDHH
jgi:iron complex outermembrane receptor protein